jgi:hypothetical protein
MQSADHVAYDGAVDYSRRIARQVLETIAPPEMPADSLDP